MSCDVAGVCCPIMIETHMPIRKSCCILRQVVFTSVIVKSYQYILFSKDIQQVTFSLITS